MNYQTDLSDWYQLYMYISCKNNIETPRITLSNRYVTIRSMFYKTAGDTFLIIRYLGYPRAEFSGVGGSAK